MQDGTDEGEALLHPVREGADPLVEEPVEAHLVGHVLDAGIQLRHAEHAAVEPQVFVGGQIIVEEGLVGEDADRAAQGDGVGAKVSAGDLNKAAIEPGQGGQAPDEGGLAGAVGTEEDEEFTPVHPEVQVVEHGRAAKGLAQSLDEDGWSLLRRCIHRGNYPELCGL